jgi:pyoverdine/dityrosine biosynthesis protein Dit1
MPCALDKALVPQADPTTSLAREIMAEVIRQRRVAGPDTACDTSPCPHCEAPHLRKVAAAIENGLPVTFVLPAFPGKSPNLEKVLGPLPDMAERRSLRFLADLCAKIQKLYAPGARVILCSDGRVFSDAVGMREEDVTAYQVELERMIDEMKLTAISTFNLDELFEVSNFDRMRSQLMAEFGEPLDELQESVRRGGKGLGASADDIEAHRLYCGITRFLVEDAMFPGQTKSRTAVQKDCRVRAYDVIRKSRAWSGLIAERFPDAVRLSIHPQACGAAKLGIRLIDPDNWMTPWHGVALEVGGRFLLVKHSQAKALGARLEYRAGRPSHFVLDSELELLKLEGIEHGA